MSHDDKSGKKPKANFSQDDVNKAVNYHVLDKKLPEKENRPPYCRIESKPEEGIFVDTKCGVKPEPVNCKLCNPRGKI